MTPDRFKQTRQLLGLTQTGLADILSVSRRSVQYWEADDGTRPPDAIACRVLEWMAAPGRPADWPEISQ